MILEYCVLTISSHTCMYTDIYLNAKCYNKALVIMKFALPYKLIVMVYVSFISSTL